MKNYLSPTVISKRALFIFILAALFYFYQFVIQVSPGIIFKPLMHKLAMNATQFGFMSASFFYLYTILQLPVGSTFDKFSAKMVLTVASLLFACSVIIFALAENIYLAIFARCIMGATSAFAFVGILTLTMRWLPAKYYAIFAGIAETIGAIGAICGNSLFAFLIKDFNWQNVYFIFAAIGIILAVMIFLIVNSHPQQTFSEAQLLSKPKLRHNIKLILNNNQTWYIAIYAFAIWAPILVFAALWGTPFLVTVNHLTLVKAANGISCVWLGIAFGSPIVGLLSGLMHRRCLFLKIGAIIGFISIVIIIFVNNINIYMLYTLLSLVGLSAAAQTISFALINDLSAFAVKSTATAFINMVAVLSGLILQPVVGKILDLKWEGSVQHTTRIYSASAYHSAFMLLPICYLLALCISLFYIKETYCKSNANKEY